MEKLSKIFENRKKTCFKKSKILKILENVGTSCTLLEKFSRKKIAQNTGSRKTLYLKEGKRNLLNSDTIN